MISHRKIQVLFHFSDSAEDAWMGWRWLEEVHHPWLRTWGFSRSLKLRSRYKLGEDRPSLSASAELSPKKLPEAAGGMIGPTFVLVHTGAIFSHMYQKLIRQSYKINESTAIARWRLDQFLNTITMRNQHAQAWCIAYEVPQVKAKGSATYDDSGSVSSSLKVTAEDLKLGTSWKYWVYLVVSINGGIQNGWSKMDDLRVPTSGKHHWSMQFSGLLSTLRDKSQMDSLWIWMEFGFSTTLWCHGTTTFWASHSSAGSTIFP